MTKTHMFPDIGFGDVEWNAEDLAVFIAKLLSHAPVVLHQVRFDLGSQGAACGAEVADGLCSEICGATLKRAVANREFDRAAQEVRWQLRPEVIAVPHRRVVGEGSDSGEIK